MGKIYLFFVLYHKQLEHVLAHPLLPILPKHLFNVFFQFFGCSDWCVTLYLLAVG